MNFQRFIDWGKNIAIAVLTLYVLYMIASSMSNSTVKVSTLSFSLNEDGTASVIGCKPKQSKPVSIPPVIRAEGKDWLVTRIAESAFQKCVLLH